MTQSYSSKDRPGIGGQWLFEDPSRTSANGADEHSGGNDKIIIVAGDQPGDEVAGNFPNLWIVPKFPFFQNRVVHGVNDV